MLVVVAGANAGGDSLGADGENRGAQEPRGELRPRRPLRRHPRRALSGAATTALEGGNAVRHVVRLQAIHDLHDAPHRRDGSDQLLDLAPENRPAKRDASVARFHSNRVRMRGVAAQLRANAPGERGVVGAVRQDARHRLGDRTRGAVPQVARSLSEEIPGLAECAPDPVTDPDPTRLSLYRIHDVHDAEADDETPVEVERSKHVLLRLPEVTAALYSGRQQQTCPAISRSGSPAPAHRKRVRAPDPL